MNELLTEQQKEEMFLANPDILAMVKRAIKKTKQETAKEIFKELEKVTSGGWAVDKKYEKIRAKFLQEKT